MRTKRITRGPINQRDYAALFYHKLVIFPYAICKLEIHLFRRIEFSKFARRFHPPVTYGAGAQSPKREINLIRDINSRCGLTTGYITPFAGFRFRRMLQRELELVSIAWISTSLPI